MKRINHWLIDSFGSIRGEVVDADGKFVSAICTSRVVKREGSVVITRTGSRYELLTPSTQYFGRGDALDAIDRRVKLVDTKDTEE